MSKVSSANYPQYTGSSVSIGNSSATTGVKDGILKSDYEMSEGEAAIYNYALNTLASILPQINTFDTNTLTSLQSEVNAYKDAGIQNINETYNPMITSLKNDIVSRFGNLDNSIFLDDLGSIEAERSDAVNSFAQNVLAKQSQLKSDELDKRYALVNLLSGLSNDIYSNALKTLSTALSGSSDATDYSTQLYNALSNLSNSESKNTNSMLSNLLGISGGSLFGGSMDL